ncbi:major facilitator superfamily transporter [Apiosordaria backusii]|uniref:Major facilitator superfamily transporter n=1 Tax=Apiosordaria backusii TaxID=314023 RepID=A0AA40K3Q3_9PEZI|nr:major facilitator superfamily transporter [Apiosordaria backusii]
MSVYYHDVSPPSPSSTCSSTAIISSCRSVGHDLRQSDETYHAEHDQSSLESHGVLSPLLPGPCLIDGASHTTNNDRNSGMQYSGISRLDNEKEAQRINRKIDLYLLPLLSLLYLFNGLDRGNIGNAQTQGFTHDIGALPDDLNLAVSLFFITFVLFQMPSAALGQWLGPSKWLPIMMLCWGVITLIQAFIWGKVALITTRLLIGVFEAGFYPTCIIYLGSFYSRFDLATRIGLFYGQYAIASAFSGALSYAIFQISHAWLKPWQLLFIIEGVLTCILGVVALLWLPTRPGEAWFLSRYERQFVVERVGGGKSGEVDYSSLTRRDLIETLRDWKLWFVLVFNICASVPATAFSVFLPLIVQGMGYKSIEANLMSVPPAVCGAVGLYLFASSSDRRRERGWHIVGALVVAIGGLIGVVVSVSNAAKYAALCVFLFGSYVPPPLTVAWLSGNTPATGKRALVVGANGLGNLAGAIGSQLYRAEYAPGYKLPLVVTLGFVGVALTGYVAYRHTLRAVNARRAAIRKLKSAEQIETERVDTVRHADRKWVFLYDL